MNKKRLILFVVILMAGLFMLPYLSMQSINVAEGADLNIVGIEWGSMFAYNFNTSKLGPAQYFCVNLPVTDSIIVGFTKIDGDGVNVLDYDLLKFSYFISGKKMPMGIDLLIGGGGTTPNITAGLGIFINVFQKRVEDVISSSLKLKIDYLLTEAVNNSGTLGLSLTGQIGF